MVWFSRKRTLTDETDCMYASPRADGVQVRFGGVDGARRPGKATVMHGGTVAASGTGFGVMAAYPGAEGFYVDGRFSWTRFVGIELTSRSRGNAADGLPGIGHVAGLEAGKRTVLEGCVTLTPRAGLAWSSVYADSFDDAAGVAGSGKVTLGKARSFRGGLGLLARTGSAAGLGVRLAGFGARVYAGALGHGVGGPGDLAACGPGRRRAP